VDGRFPKRFGDITERSYAYKYNLVALFDFVTPSDREVMRQWGNAWDVLVNTNTDQIGQAMAGDHSRMAVSG
jgi:hypothetical protein